MFAILIFALAGAFTLFLIYVALVWLPREMHEAYRGAFRALGAAVEERQPVMSGHAARVADLSIAIAMKLGFRKKSLHIIEYAALLHDIGKVSIPYLILNSDQPLTFEQEEQLREHADEGAKMLIEANTPKEIAPLVFHHHRRFDELLANHSLPSRQELLATQIIAVANTMDSMLQGTGAYEKMSKSRAIGALWQGSGTLYHPQVVEVVTRLVMEEGDFDREPEAAEIAA